jgi:hypothetical protein
MNKKKIAVFCMLPLHEVEIQLVKQTGGHRIYWAWHDLKGVPSNTAKQGEWKIIVDTKDVGGAVTSYPGTADDKAWEILENRALEKGYIETADKTVRGFVAGFDEITSEDGMLMIGAMTALSDEGRLPELEISYKGHNGFFENSIRVTLNSKEDLEKIIQQLQSVANELD